LAGEKTRPDHFGVTDVGNPVGDRGTKSAHSDRPSVRVCMREPMSTAERIVYSDLASTPLNEETFRV